MTTTMHNQAQNDNTNSQCQTHTQTQTHKNTKTVSLVWIGGFPQSILSPFSPHSELIQN